MKYVKTPVVVKRDAPRNMVGLYDADGKYIALRFGGDDRAAQFQEIATSLSEHDALIAQRDALVGVCEAQQQAIEAMIEEWAKRDMLGALDHRLYSTALADGRAALALVRGEDFPCP
jgi:hypothetical protein